jgi:hypothetical protein
MALAERWKIKSSEAIIMYIGFFNFYQQYNQNKIFTDKSFGECDDSRYAVYTLGQYLQGLGHQVRTIDLEPELQKFDRIVFLEFPTLQNQYFQKLLALNYPHLYLILLESEFIRPDNRIENHSYFKKIGTWRDDWVDGIRYFKINFAHRILKTVCFDLTLKEKLCTMVITKKPIRSEPVSLLGERVRAAEWFAQNYPADFDVYGRGWEPRDHSSYRGKTPSKYQTLQKYRFCLCYENAKDIPGYITEKIIDCFTAGCVPVYLGAPNITAHIPAATFVDKRNFSSYEELYRYLKQMPEAEYLQYLNAIKLFFESDQSYYFSTDYFNKAVAHQMLGLS